MKTHSEFTKYLLTAENLGVTIDFGLRQGIISYTKNGIQPEGGALAGPLVTLRLEDAEHIMRILKLAIFPEKLAQTDKPDWLADSADQAEADGDASWDRAAPTPAPVPVATKSTSATGFRWGAKSKRELVGVKKELVACATLALQKYSKIDFMCFDGLRTQAEQRRHVKNGVSRTMNSKHLIGLAVDLVPIIGGVPKWDWEGCFQVAYAMDWAATEMGIAKNIRWGGAWDRTLADFGGQVDAYRNEVKLYQARNPGPDFIDGPHFEWKD